MKKNLRYILLLTSLQSIIFFGCKRQDDWLNVKAANSDVTPSTLTDYQAILDNTTIMNMGFPDASIGSTDNTYVTDGRWPSLSDIEQNIYLWSPNFASNGAIYDWNSGYGIVNYANIVLDGIQKIVVDGSVQSTYNNIKGEALFFRAIGHYYIATEYCKPYTAGTANGDLGVPLRMTSDINVHPGRGTVQQVYDQIIKDLNDAAALLPLNQSKPTRPSSVAANALLAKVYLNMEKYSDALNYSNIVLSQKNTLIDFNNKSLVDTTSTRPFPSDPVNNPEIIFYGDGITYLSGGVYLSATSVKEQLINTFSSNDLRKPTFFSSNGDGTFRFKGTYDAFNRRVFCGLATNEIYLIRAECNARAGNTNAALSDLNALLQKRWRNTVPFPAITATNADDALSKILIERRKELLMMGNCRWEDLRRLNKDIRFATTITKTVLGQTYTLPPNDPRYVFLIPNEEIQLTGIQQNPR